jgi:hypothetical protein
MARAGLVPPSLGGGGVTDERIAVAGRLVNALAAAADRAEKLTTQLGSYSKEALVEYVAALNKYTASTPGDGRICVFASHNMLCPGSAYCIWQDLRGLRIAPHSVHWHDNATPEREWYARNIAAIISKVALT